MAAQDRATFVQLVASERCGSARGGPWIHFEVTCDRAGFIGDGDHIRLWSGTSFALQRSASSKNLWVGVVPRIEVERGPYGFKVEHPGGREATFEMCDLRALPAMAPPGSLVIEAVFGENGQQVWSAFQSPAVLPQGNPRSNATYASTLPARHGNSRSLSPSGSSRAAFENPSPWSFGVPPRSSAQMSTLLPDRFFEERQPEGQRQSAPRLPSHFPANSESAADGSCPYSPYVALADTQREDRPQNQFVGLPELWASFASSRPSDPIKEARAVQVARALLGAEVDPVTRQVLSQARMAVASPRLLER